MHKTTGAPYRVSQVAHCVNYAWAKELLLGNHRLMNARLEISGSSEEAAIGLAVSLTRKTHAY